MNRTSICITDKLTAPPVAASNAPETADPTPLAAALGSALIRIRRLEESIRVGRNGRRGECVEKARMGRFLVIKHDSVRTSIGPLRLLLLVEDVILNTMFRDKTCPSNEEPAICTSTGREEV